MDLDKFLKNLQQEDEQVSDNNSNNSPYLKSIYIKDGETLSFRIYPNLKDANGNPFQQNFIHGGFKNPKMLDNNGNPRNWVYPCQGKDCVLCAYAKSFPEDSQEYFRKKASTQFDYYIQLPNGEARKLSISYAAHQNLKAAIIEAAKTGVNSVDLDTGRLFEVTRRRGQDKVIWSASMTDEEVPLTKAQKARLKDIIPLEDLNKQELSKEDLQDVVDLDKGVYKSKDEKVKEDNIDEGEALDLELPEDDIDSPDETFDFDSVDIDIDDDIKFEDDE